jgi:ABC-type uncharacterized transport system substrate-binding protein
MRTGNRTTWALLLATLVLASLFPAGALFAHPHVWVMVETEILYGKDEAIMGFRHKWSFDEDYTRFAIQGLDKNGDGIYSREELQSLAEVNVTSMKEFDYFTFAKVNGTVIERGMPQDYYLEYKDRALTLHFTLPLAQSIPADRLKYFTLKVYDPSFYVDFAFAEKSPIRLKDAPPGCVAVLEEPQPEKTTAPALSQGEAFSGNANAIAGLAEQYAKTVTITCAAKPH